MRELQPGNTQKNNLFIFCLKLNGPFGFESMTLASSVLGSSQLRADWPSGGLLQLISSRHFYIRDKTALYKMDGVKNSLVAMLCIINKEYVHWLLSSHLKSARRKYFRNCSIGTCSRAIRSSWVKAMNASGHQKVYFLLTSSLAV